MTFEGIDLATLYGYPPEGRWLRTNFVTTLDGAAYDLDGLTANLGSATDTEVFALLRSLADVIIVGAATARTEGYEPVQPREIDGDLRARLGLSTLPPIAVASNSLRIPPKLLTSDQIVITHQTAPFERLATSNVDLIVAGRSEVDWCAALDALGERGYRRLLCEGGPTLHGCLIENDLVDDICLTISPVLAAGGAPRIAHGMSPDHRPMRLAHSVQQADTLFTRWIRSTYATED